MGFWTEFKSFAVKGNAFDLAVAVVVGNAFSAVVNSLVSDIITPFIGLLTNNIDFKNLSWTPHTGVVVQYGALIQAVINFFIISLAIFIIFKMVSSTRKSLFKEEKKTPPPPEQKPADVRLLEEIRDLLKEKKGV